MIRFRPFSDTDPVLPNSPILKAALLTAADLYAVNKVLNEHDFPPLIMLHDVMLSANLARHYKGTMRLTKLAHELKAKPAALWALLAEHLLSVIDHTQYTRFGDPLVGNWDTLLNVINMEAQNGVAEERLCSVLFGIPETDYLRQDYRLVATFYIHVLRPALLGRIAYGAQGR